MGKTVLKEKIHLRVGDLVVDKDSSEAGILLQKHKVLRGYEPKELSPIRRSYYAWRIKWNKETSKENEMKWYELFENTFDERKLLRDIKDGRMEHYSSNNTTCN